MVKLALLKSKLQGLVACLRKSLLTICLNLSRKIVKALLIRWDFWIIATFDLVLQILDQKLIRIAHSRLSMVLVIRKLRVVHWDF